ncbi:TAXI family TRAP transporter solute-binding subunit [Jannaschia sp. CCS1]|uniref:TAXI family TRAP transporter solute-binding subunit n=1 Tax=Jannaschia sp. (strain CCS1) TaxID=290400 RepID=UPI000053D7B5|nr:TAXI family TRAP transporter solute-binding subunit [Jannaschia sp. CCS1]ABD56714.1 TRAP transporter solute receptor TAXI family [Jannaschia sp. CCS1]
MTKPFAGALVAAFVALAAPVAAQTVGVATSNPGSLFHNIGTAVANAANAGGVNSTIQPATSPNQYIPFVNAGGIEFGVANLQEVNYALTGAEWWNGVENPDLRIVAMLQPLVTAIFVRADSDITDLAGLAGQPVTDGYTAQNTILPQLSAYYATAGMTRDDIDPINVTSVVAGGDAFMAGDTVAFYFAHGAGKVREADAAVGGLRALPVADPSDEALAAAQNHWPTAFFMEMAAGSMPGIAEDGTFIAFPQVIFTHAGVPDEVVYAFTQALHDNASVMGETFPPMRAFRPEHMRADAGVAAFHPGAIQFYDEIGIE